MAFNVLSDEILEQILDKLCAETAADHLRWVAQSETVFTARTGKFSYEIWCEDQDDLPPYLFTISNNTAEIASTRSILGDNLSERVKQRNILLYLLYRAAQLQAFNLRDVGQAILDDLASLDEEPF
jgi:hypothetical protein